MISIYILKKLFYIYPDHIITVNILSTRKIHYDYSDIIAKSMISEKRLTKLTRSPMEKLDQKDKCFSYFRCTLTNLTI